MSIFGTREDDPLLENDPLAPSSDDEQEGDAPPDEDASSKAALSDEETASQSGSEEVRPSSRPGFSNSEEPASVFGAGSSAEVNAENHFRFDGSEETRVIVRSAEELTRGRLTMLNSALDVGWRIDRVKLRKGASPANEATTAGPSSGDASVELVFVLHRRTET